MTVVIFGQMDSIRRHCLNHDIAKVNLFFMNFSRQFCAEQVYVTTYSKLAHQNDNNNRSRVRHIYFGRFCSYPIHLTDD